MLSANSFAINKFNIKKDEISYNIDNKDVYGDVYVKEMRLPTYSIISTDENLEITPHKNIDDIEEALGKIFANRIHVDNWDLYANDNTLNIEHSLEASRKISSYSHLDYDEYSYYTNLKFTPTNMCKPLFMYINIDCNHYGEAEVMRNNIIHNTLHVRHIETNVIDNKVLIILLFKGNFLHYDANILNMLILNRNINVDVTCLDINGFPIRINFIPTDETDEYVEIKYDSKDIVCRGYRNKPIQLNYDNRYIFYGSGVNMIDFVDPTYLSYYTEKGIVSKSDFYSKTFDHKYIILHPSRNIRYFHRITNNGNIIRII